MKTEQARSCFLPPRKAARRYWRPRLVAVIASLLAPSATFAADFDRDALFHIERAKNANIVQYDAHVSPNGLLDKGQPVEAYWVRHADMGQVENLTRVQEKFAYGFKAKLSSDRLSATLDMAANLGREISVVRVQDDYRAVARISDQKAYLDTIYIHDSGKGLSTKVHYIELRGRATNGDLELTERFSP